MESETSKIRDLVLPYCKGIGLDLGSGGDPVVPHAIQVDPLPKGYARVGDAPIQIPADATTLPWFGCNQLDFVYASHLLEDFPEISWNGILEEWGRVIKPGGYLILICPHHDVYHGVNLCHQHEPVLGDLPYHAGLALKGRVALEILSGYSIVFVYQLD